MSANALLTLMGEQGKSSGNDFEIVEQEYALEEKFFMNLSYWNLHYRNDFRKQHKLLGCCNGGYLDSNTVITGGYETKKEWSSGFEAEDRVTILSLGRNLFNASGNPRTLRAAYGRYGLGIELKDYDTGAFYGEYIKKLFMGTGFTGVFFTDEFDTLYALGCGSELGADLLLYTPPAIVDTDVKSIRGFTTSSTGGAIGYLKNNGDLYLMGNVGYISGTTLSWSSTTQRYLLATDVVDFYIACANQMYITSDGCLYARGMNRQTVYTEAYDKRIQGSLFGDSFSDFMETPELIDTDVVKICSYKGLIQASPNALSFCYLKRDGTLIGCGYHVYGLNLEMSSKEYAQNRYVIDEGVTNAWETNGCVYYLKNGCTYVFGKNSWCCLGIGKFLDGVTSTSYKDFISDTPRVLDPVKIADEEVEFVFVVPTDSVTTSNVVDYYDAQVSYVKYKNSNKIITNGYLNWIGDAFLGNSMGVGLELPELPQD
jgi:hypothetical protein